MLYVYENGGDRSLYGPTSVSHAEKMTGTLSELTERRGDDRDALIARRLRRTDGRRRPATTNWKQQNAFFLMVSSDASERRVPVSSRVAQRKSGARVRAWHRRVKGFLLIGPLCHHRRGPCWRLGPSRSVGRPSC
jgi:hypothetical protein